MSRRDRSHLNYARLEKLLRRPLADLALGDHFRLRSGAYMDLSIEVIERQRDAPRLVVAMAHYYEQNGDLCPDPEMTIALEPPTREPPASGPYLRTELGWAEALTFQQTNPTVYQRVYPRPGVFDPRLRQQLNGFLATWLVNLGKQGHRPIDPSNGP